MTPFVLEDLAESLTVLHQKWRQLCRKLADSFAVCLCTHIAMLMGYIIFFNFKNFAFAN